MRLPTPGVAIDPVSPEGELAAVRDVRADAAVAFVAGFHEGVGIRLGESGDYAVKGVADGPEGSLRLLVGAAKRFGEDLIHDATLLHVPCGQLQRLGGLG